MERAETIIIIGGSAGSYNLITKVLEKLPNPISAAICIIIHRSPSYNTQIEKSLANKLKRPLFAISDKMQIYRNHIYFAPPDYHLLIEPNYTFALDCSEPINYSRPAIDITFESCAQIYKDKASGFILSGANNDGALGLKTMEKYGAQVYIQHPDDAKIATMPLAAMSVTTQPAVLHDKQILEYFCSLS